jgi:hypothetical protein
VRKEALLGLAKSRPFMTYASKDDKRRSKSQLITDTLKELEYLERKVIGSDPDMENEDTPSMLDKLRRAKEYFTKMGGGNIAPQSVVS